jgi:hypothetical protein
LLLLLLLFFKKPVTSLSLSRARSLKGCRSGSEQNKKKEKTLFSLKETTVAFLFKGVVVVVVVVF